MLISSRHKIGLLLICLMTAGCGGGSTPSGCPSDFNIPEKMEILGSEHDQSLFILRLKTDQLSITEVLTEFKKSMSDNEWEMKSDSATDKGGELEFGKDKRKCLVFVAPEKKSENGSVKIDIKCDREKAQ